MEIFENIYSITNSHLINYEKWLIATKKINKSIQIKKIEYDFYVSISEMRCSIMPYDLNTNTFN